MVNARACWVRSARSFLGAWGVRTGPCSCCERVGEDGDRREVRPLKRRYGPGLAVVALTVLWGCSSPRTGIAFESALNDDAITVGSFDFAESKVLAEVYSQALEAAGFHVVRAFGLGPREFVAPALQRGLIEFVPEYAGTATSFLSIGRTTSGEDVATTHAQLVRSLGNRGLTALAAAP